MHTMPRLEDVANAELAQMTPERQNYDQNTFGRRIRVLRVTGMDSGKTLGRQHQSALTFEHPVTGKVELPTHYFTDRLCTTFMN